MKSRVGDVGEPLDLRRHLGQPVKLGGVQELLGRGDRGRKLIVHRHQFARLRLMP
jgi:hypothetical protein